MFLRQTRLHAVYIPRCASRMPDEHTFVAQTGLTSRSCDLVLAQTDVGPGIRAHRQSSGRLNPAATPRAAP